MSKLLEQLRSETPACRKLVHLNNAGTALSPDLVTRTVLDHLRLEQEIGGYEAETVKQDELEEVYRSLADLIGAAPHEMAVTQNATRAWDMLFYAVPLKPGDQIFTCQNEYASNYMAFLQRQKTTGAEIVVLDNDESGAVCPDSLKRRLTSRTKIVAVNHIPTNGGVIQPAEELGSILRDHPAFYLLDACQSVGQLPLNVEKLGCDALTATARKYLRGPRGIGFLYLASEHIQKLEPPFIDLHAATWTAPGVYQFRNDARRFETYEVFFAGKLGLGAAARYHSALDQEWAFRRLSGLAEAARRGLAEIEGVHVHDLGRKRGGIVTFTVAGVHPDTVREMLGRRLINIWTSTVRSARLDMEARGLEVLGRASFHYYNTESEVETFLAAVQEIAQGSRRGFGRTCSQA